MRCALSWEALYVGEPAPELERYRRAITGYADDL
jgi:hypothetical protein